jgi:alpha-mannosidase
MHKGRLLIFLMAGAWAGPRADAAAVDPAGQRKAQIQGQIDRLARLTDVSLPDWRWHAGGLAHGEAVDLDDAKWESFKTGQHTPLAHGWLRRWIEIPSRRDGYDLRGARALLELGLDGDDLGALAIYVNGQRVFYGELPDPIALNTEPGQRVLVAIKVNGAFGEMVLYRATLTLVPSAGQPDPQKLARSLSVAEALAGLEPSQQRERQRQIDEALHAIAWSALERGDSAAFSRSLAAATQKLEQASEWMKKYTVRVTGNAHIDMAWLWPWTETVDVVKRTFMSALSLMRDYPEFTFSQSSAAAFEWMRDKYPQLFDEIRRRVKEGRWEIVGGMWVEPDLNMPDGESLVRQLFYGKRWFRDQLGVDVRVGWNPDSFGFSRQLPQIYKRSGVDYFLTQKLHWNDTNEFPLRAFWWEAPDGSRVLTYFPSRYDGPAEPQQMATDLADMVRHKAGSESMSLYGVGDHGGGPTRRMVEQIQSWQAPAAVFPRIVFGTAKSFFEQLAKIGSTLPVWKDELYLEYHRGVFTTQAETKKASRRAEAGLINAEKLSALGWLFGGSYDSNALDEAWKKVLFNQFHDIAAGSGIPVLYRDAARDYAEVGRVTDRLRSDALDGLLARVNTSGAGAAAAVVNPLSWERTDVVEAELPVEGNGGNGNDIEVRDADGTLAVSELLHRDAATGRARVRFVAERVPALGYKVYHVISSPSARHAETTLMAHGTTIENELLRVVVDAATGCITSLWDKRQNREALAPNACANRLQAFADNPKQWDAWNIDADFEKKSWNVDGGSEVKLLEKGPARAVVRVKHTFQSSTLIQDITLYPHVPRVDVRMEVDWREKHILLKAAFPAAAHSDVATYEIPYGTIERPTTRRNSNEQAKFEVPALRFADLSDGQTGLSVLNDCKYGYDTKDNIIRLSLLRGPTWPDPHADEGVHHFVYALYPHAGGWLKGGTLQRGYELNQPLLAVAQPRHEGMLPPARSFVSLRPANLILSALKKASDDEALIVRFYEIGGMKSEAELRLPPGAWRAVETNLLEKEEHPLVIQDGVVRVPTGPYQIKSVKVLFKH